MQNVADDSLQQFLENSALLFDSCVSACSNDFHSYRNQDELVSGISSRSLPPWFVGEIHSHEKASFVGASIQKSPPLLLVLLKQGLKRRAGWDSNQQ